LSVKALGEQWLSSMGERGKVNPGILADFAASQRGKNERQRADLLAALIKRTDR
jgi:hypothetical protein